MVFSVNTAGTDVNGYLWLPSSDGTFSMSTGILQITADRTAGTVEFTGGGVGFGFCAIHYRSNASNVWIYMNPEGVGTSCDYDTSGVTDSADYSEICLNASDMTEVSASNCATLKADATLTLIGRAASTNASSTTWAASAPPSTGSIHRIDLNDLQTLFTHTATMTGVPSL